MGTTNDSTGLTERERVTRRNVLVFNAWTLAFVATFLVGGYLLRTAERAPDGALGIALSLVPVVPGALAFHAFVRFVRGADEMLRAVLAEGLVFGFAAAVVFWGAIQVPEHVWLPKVKADWLMAVLLIATGAGVVRARWRRR